MQKLAGVLLLWVSCWASAHAALPQALQRALERHHLPGSSLSVVAVPLTGGNPLINYRADIPRNPASVMKLLTTFAALDLLGPAYLWHTHYYIDGELREGVLDGNLIIKGEGDPYLVLERFWVQLAALRQRGIKTILGKLLIDDSAFDLPAHDRAAFDHQPTRLYNVGPSATVVNFNASRFRIHPVDGKVEVIVDPPLENIRIDNQLKAAAGSCHGPRGGWSMQVGRERENARISFTGRYRVQCGDYELPRSVLDSNAYLYGLFRYLWHSLGGEIQGGYAGTRVSEDAEPFYSGESKPLAEVIAGTNKYSNNLLARQLLLTLGYQAHGAGVGVDDGIKALTDWLAQSGLDMPELKLENGAGLARDIRISAGSVIRLLLYAAGSPYQPEYFASLPLIGVDGTMQKRLSDLNLGGRGRIKTGYLKGVRTLAGFLRADSGVDYAVVLFLDDEKIRFENGNAIQDAFIRWVLEAG